MKTRLFIVALFALAAATAQAAPEIELRAGAIDLGPLGSSTYVGLGVRHRFNDTFAAYGTVDQTVSSSTAFDVSFTQVGAHLEAGKSFDWLRVTVKAGVVYTDGEVANIGTTDTAPAYGVELRWKRMSVGWSQTEYANQTITSTSLIFHF